MIYNDDDDDDDGDDVYVLCIMTGCDYPESTEICPILLPTPP